MAFLGYGWVITGLLDRVGNGFFRLRVGNYRVIYKSSCGVIIIYYIRHRKSAYD